MPRDTIPDGLASKVPSFDENTPLTKVLTPALENSAVIITRSGAYSGIIDSYAIYRHIQDFRLDKKDRAGRISLRVPTITSSTEINDALYYFYKNRTRALPFSKNDKVIGLVMRPTMIKVLLSKGMLSGMSTEDVMSYPLIGIDAASTVTQARSAMKKHKIDRLAVFEKDRFVGVLTSYDMVHNIARVSERLPEMKSSTYSPSNIVVSSIALSNPMTIDAKKPLSDAARALVENNISSIIITKNGKPAGILTELDIITGVMASQSDVGSKIFISGLDQATYIYEDEAREALKSFLKKAERMKNIKINYVSVVIRKFKSNSYDIHARVSFGKGSSVSVYKTGHIFERTFSDTIRTLENNLKKEKEISIKMWRTQGGTSENQE